MIAVPGGEHARGQPLPLRAGARDLRRQGHDLLQAPLQGRQRTPCAAMRQRLRPTAPRASQKRGVGARARSRRCERPAGVAERL